MVFFNYALRKLNAKIVYYGPGLCGKTTNLQWIHDHFDGGQRGKMISLATEGDRTIFFDLLPIEIGTIRGMEVTLQLYTVPGQVHYNSTRQLVLRGADGVVFVADSQRSMKKSNVESLKNLQENLLLQGIGFTDFPHVLQFNKQDLRDLLSVEELDADLNLQSCPFFEAVAVNGIGVQETLEGIVKLVMRKLRDRYESVSTGGPRPAGVGVGGGPKPMGAPKPAPMPPAPAPEPPSAPAFEAPVPAPEPEPEMPQMPVMPPLEKKPKPEVVPPPPLEPQIDIPEKAPSLGSPFETPSSAIEPPEPQVVAFTEMDDDDSDQDNVTTAVFGDTFADGAIDPSTFSSAEDDGLDVLVDEVEPLSEQLETGGADENEITSTGILIEDEDDDDDLPVDLVVERDEVIYDGVFATSNEEIEVEPIGLIIDDPEPVEIVQPEQVEELTDTEPVESSILDSYLADDEPVLPLEDEISEPSEDVVFDSEVEVPAADVEEPRESSADAVDSFFESKTDTGILYPPEAEDLEEEVVESGDPFSDEHFVDQVRAPGPFSTVKPEEDASQMGENVFGGGDEERPITQAVDVSEMEFEPEVAGGDAVDVFDQDDLGQDGDAFGEDRPFDTAPLDPSVLPVDVEMSSVPEPMVEEELEEPEIDEEIGFATVSAESPDALAEMLQSRVDDGGAVSEDEVSDVVTEDMITEPDEVFAFGGDDPFDLDANIPAETPAIVAEVVVEEPPLMPEIKIGPQDNKLALRLQGTGAIAEAGQLREIEIEVPVPGAWVGNKKVTLSLRLTLVPSAEEGDDGADSAS